MRLGFLLAAGFILAAGVHGQEALRDTGSLSPDWRRIGNSAVDLYLASPATGPVDRVWFSEDGGRLYVRIRGAAVFETDDFENWRGPEDVRPPTQLPPDLRFAGPPPDAEDAVRVHPRDPSRIYAAGSHVYRSDDGGQHWINLTRFRRDSIIGGGMRDLAVAPGNPDEVVVANSYGVWRSLDGGLSWTGLNQFLPNLPVSRLLETPAGVRGMRIQLDGLGVAEWTPGEKQAWRLTEDPMAGDSEEARRAAAAALGARVTALARSGDAVYAGAADGRIWVSLDDGQSWRLSRAAGGGGVNALHVDRQDFRLAYAALAPAGDGGDSPRVLKTFNAGAFWDDLTANLPPGDVHGIAADTGTGAIYAATGEGLFLTFAEIFAQRPAMNWIPMSGNLPPAPAVDVRLDPAGNQVFLALAGHGVFVAPAPHPFAGLRVVNTADLSRRPAAPGSLLSVLGGRLLRARAGLREAPILHTSEFESQIQVPFEVAGPSTGLSLESSRGATVVTLPVQEVSPAIFVDRDGTPLLLDASTGVLLDAMSTARSGSRVQVLATGLGRVRPSWPTGMAAPLETPPEVVAPVRVYLDRSPVEVTRATLAPGFVGFYLVEIELPHVVNTGPAELFLEAGDHESNRVRIYLEP